MSKLEITIRALMLAHQTHTAAGDTAKADDCLIVARWHYRLGLEEKSRMAGNADALARCIPLAEECELFVKNGR